MKLHVSRTMGRIPSILFYWALRSLVRSYEVYHPVISKGERIAAGQRGCDDRWALISTEIVAMGVESVLDLGCAEGYFVRQAALQHGCVSLGVDGDVRRLLVAQTSTVQDCEDRVGFMFAAITPELIERLPEFDLVLYQSVLHHVMYEHGQEHARRTLRQIRAKTRKAMIFDMGQSNELASPWARLLPDMGPNPHAWIKVFLESAGFTEVRKLGETDAYREQVQRAVFIARP